MKKHIYTLVVFILLFVACSTTTNDDGFTIPSEITDINTTLKIVPAEKEFAREQGSDFLIQNFSPEYQLYFSADTDIQVFAWNNKKWIQIQNDVIYYPSSDIYLQSSQMDTPGWKIISIAPTFLVDDQIALNQKAKVRILIVATIIKGGQLTDKKIAAYVDVWIHP